MSKKIGVRTPKKRFAAWASLAYQWSFPAETIPITSEPGPPVLFVVVLFIQSGVQHPILLVVCLDQSCNDFHKQACTACRWSRLVKWTFASLPLSWMSRRHGFSIKLLLDARLIRTNKNSIQPMFSICSKTFRPTEWNRMNEGGQFPRFTFVSSSVVYFTTWWNTSNRSTGVSRPSVCWPEEVPAPKRRNDLPVGLEIQVQNGCYWGNLG